jgi:hypothetical protein
VSLHAMVAKRKKKQFVLKKKIQLLYYENSKLTKLKPMLLYNCMFTKTTYTNGRACVCLCVCVCVCVRVRARVHVWVRGRGVTWCSASIFVSPYLWVSSFIL